MSYTMWHHVTLCNAVLHMSHSLIYYNYLCRFAGRIVGISLHWSWIWFIKRREMAVTDFCVPTASRCQTQPQRNGEYSYDTEYLDYSFYLSFLFFLPPSISCTFPSINLPWSLPPSLPPSISCTFSSINLPWSLPPKGSTSVFSPAPPLPCVAHHMHGETKTKSGPCQQWTH